jgi:DNA-directed RNA polymerase specialized sigma24 family protein
MLEILSKNNDLWFRMALQICRDEDTAKDLVQDMYLKLYKADKELSNIYVYFTLKSIYTDQVKESSTKNRIDLINDFANFEIEFDTYDFNQDNEVQSKLDLIDDCLNSVPLARKLIVTHSIEDGLRKFSRDSQINKATVQKHRKEFKNMVWQRKQKD